MGLQLVKQLQPILTAHFLASLAIGTNLSRSTVLKVHTVIMQFLNLFFNKCFAYFKIKLPCLHVDIARSSFNLIAYFMLSIFFQYPSVIYFFHLISGFFSVEKIITLDSKTLPLLSKEWFRVDMTEEQMKLQTAVKMLKDSLVLEAWLASTGLIKMISMKQMKEIGIHGIQDVETPWKRNEMRVLLETLPSAKFDINDFEATIEKLKLNENDYFQRILKRQEKTWGWKLVWALWRMMVILGKYG